jgi:hypothetical protein
MPSTVGVGAKQLIILVLISCISMMIFKESSVGASEMVDYYSNDEYEQQQKQLDNDIFLEVISFSVVFSPW